MVNKLVEVAFPSEVARASGIKDIEFKASALSVVVTTHLTWFGKDGPWAATLDFSSDNVENIEQLITVCKSYIRRIENNKGVLV